MNMMCSERINRKRRMTGRKTSKEKIRNERKGVRKEGSRNIDDKQKERGED